MNRFLDHLTEGVTSVTTKTVEKLANEGKGFGYFGHTIRSPRFGAAAQMFDQMLIDTAKKMRWSLEELGAFGDSKNGRWLGDELTSLFTYDMDDDNAPPKPNKGMKQDAQDLFIKYMRQPLDSDAISDWVEKVADAGLSTGPGPIA